VGEAVISIFSLIYKSTKYIDAVYGSIVRHTPEIQNGTAEFFFVANGATDRVKSHLRERDIPHYIVDHEVQTLAQVEALGFAAPEYMCRVYKGYNFGLDRCKGDVVVPINSDHLFSPNWLSRLVAHVDDKTLPSSLLVEPGHPRFRVFHAAVQGAFGRTPETFQEGAFLDFAASIARPGETKKGGAYMPVAMLKDAVMRVGKYPEGNLAVPPNEEYRVIAKRGRQRYSVAFGDIVLFHKLRQLGFEHVTALDSIVYHIKEGEKDE
jgi:glycosyltransferase involved in cell wall biosynthesis